jgi:hypothetical protein
MAAIRKDPVGKEVAVKSGEGGAMKHFNKFTSAAFLLSLSVAATPAFAQRHSPQDRGASGNSGGGGARAESRGGGEQNGGGGNQNRGGGDQNRGGERRAQAPAPAPAPRADTQQRAQESRGAAPRQDQRQDQRVQRGQAIPRESPRGGAYQQRGFDRGRVVTGRPYYGYSRPYYTRPYYSRPYYSFRPRLSLGFGLWLGYPVTYPYGAYDYPYAYPDSYPDAYPDAYPDSYPGGAVNVAPSPNVASGGLSFEISPATATVYIDGQYVGVVSDFTPNMPPLGLTPGRHRIEIRDPGFETMTFDANIVAGQVLPYQGTMQRF